jgi:hypothetical protein
MEVNEQIDGKWRIDSQYQIKLIPSTFNPTITLGIFSASLWTYRSITRASETSISLFPEPESPHPHSAHRRTTTWLPELARPNTEDQDIVPPPYDHKLELENLYIDSLPLQN